MLSQFVPGKERQKEEKTEMEWCIAASVSLYRTIHQGIGKFPSPLPKYPVPFIWNN
jgi:hypothetical protein